MTELAGVYGLGRAAAGGAHLHALLQPFDVDYGGLGKNPHFICVV